MLLVRNALLRKPQQQQLRFLSAATALKAKPKPARVDVVFISGDGSGKETKVFGHVGDTLLDVAQDNEIEIEGACGGAMACSTCHVILEEKHYTAPKSEEEEDMLDLAVGLQKTSRLGCQVELEESMNGMRVQLPSEVKNRQV